MAQILFKTLRVRKYIHPYIDFLAVRVMEPDEDDWHKLRRLLKYLRGTICMPLILRADSLNVIKWWVDALYALHGDMRGHNGAITSLGCRS